MKSPQPSDHGPTPANRRPAIHDPRPSIDDPRSTSHANGPRSTNPEHALAHARADEHEDAHEQSDAPSAALHLAGPFPHEKLDAYRVALEMAALAKELAEKIPRGHRNVADHLQRAAEDTVLLFAEGANRRGRALKSQRFVESRGEVGEVAAAGDLIIVLGLGSRTKAERMKHLAARVSAMLTRMIARLE
jgi:four helix bundle protein